MANRVVLVTGASRGIGRAIALRLAHDGYAVAVNFRTEAAKAAEVVTAARVLGATATAVQADVGDAGQVREMVATVERELGPVDVLVNNAGVLAKGDIGDFDLSRMEGMRRINVDGLVHVTRSVVDGMKARGFGRIINLTSIAALGTAKAGTTFYAATKAAVITLTRRFALDLGPHGITVNAIAPGFILTDMATSSGMNLDAVTAVTMMRRAGTPEDIAHAAAFLAHESSSFITAQVLTVDGGRMDYIAHP
ncbi:MAG: SDR family oxidoreductase [Bryobacteraceae bacterium]